MFDIGYQEKLEHWNISVTYDSNMKLAMPSHILSISECKHTEVQHKEWTFVPRGTKSQKCTKQNGDMGQYSWLSLSLGSGFQIMSGNIKAQDL